MAAPPQPTPDTQHLSYIHTDADLPPVAIIDRSPIGTKHKIFFGVIAVLGAVAWAVIAFVRGETVNAVWFVVAAICTYVIGYRFYARLIEAKIVRPRDDYATPAEIFDDGTDYVPTDRRVLFGHHFAAIAGAGPLVGPVLATQMGYLPCSIWIIVGAVFAGAVQDYLVLSISTRRRGRSLGQMARDELGAIGGAAALVGTFVIMVIIIAVLALVVVRALAQSPWGVFSIAMTIPIAVVHGLLFAIPATRAGSGSVRDRLRAVDARRGIRRCRQRNRLGRIVVESITGDGVMADRRLWIRRVGAAGVVAARAARLPVDVHEDRSHRVAGDRHLHRAPGRQRTGGLALRHSR